MILPYLPIPLNRLLASFPFQPNLNLWANLTSIYCSLFTRSFHWTQKNSKFACMVEWPSLLVPTLEELSSPEGNHTMQSITPPIQALQPGELYFSCWAFTSVCSSSFAVLLLLSPAFQIDTRFLKFLLSSLSSHFSSPSCLPLHQKVLWLSDFVFSNFGCC